MSDSEQMSRPQRVQRRRTRGWRMPEGAVYVGRPTIWGNPFRVGGLVVLHADNTERGYTAELPMTAEQTVAGYRDLMHTRTNLLDGEAGDDWIEDRVQGWRDALARLTGHDLACWCPLDQPCHADVLLELANEPPEEPR